MARLFIKGVGVLDLASQRFDESDEAIATADDIYEHKQQGKYLSEVSLDESLVRKITDAAAPIGHLERMLETATGNVIEAVQSIVEPLLAQGYFLSKETATLKTNF